MLRNEVWWGRKEGDADLGQIVLEHVGLWAAGLLSGEGKKDVREGLEEYVEKACEEEEAGRRFLVVRQGGRGGGQ